MPAESTSPETIPGVVLKALHTPVDAPTLVVAGAMSFPVLALLLARPLTWPAPAYGFVFEFLFYRNEPAAAILALAIVVLGLLASRSARFSDRFFVSKLAAEPRAFIAAVTLVLAAAAVIVYRAHPLSMDEYAPLFQARVFARGRLHAQVPPELVSRLIPPIRWFITATPDGSMISAYWPGLALLLTPFVWLGCPWLLNPLLGGLTLLLVWRLARRFWPDTAAPGWAMLLTAASPAFTVNAISYYSMTAHLAASLAFALFVLEGRWLAAGAVGSLALSLHNPVPHTLVALPFIVWVACQRGAPKKLFRLAAGYLPGVVVLVFGWMWYRAGFVDPGKRLTADVWAICRAAFAMPSLDVLLERTMNVTELVDWAVPLAVPLAVLGAVRCRGNTGARLLTASALVTLGAYAFVTWSQGHGWGFRYFHPIWAVVPLLAAGALESSVTAPALRKLALFAALSSLALCTPLRFFQVRTFIDSHLAQVPPPAQGRQVVFLDPGRGSYILDLIQNDPFLDGTRWILLSHGSEEDARFMRRFPNARMTIRTAAAELWQLD